MPDYVVARVVSMLNDEQRSVNGARILLLGLAYKAGHERLAGGAVDDDRRAPRSSSVPTCGRTTRSCPRTRRSVRRSTRVACSVEELEAADLVVLCVDHAELPYDDIVDHARLVLDTRGRLRGLGFRGESL